MSEELTKEMIQAVVDLMNKHKAPEPHMWSFWCCGCEKEKMRKDAPMIWANKVFCGTKCAHDWEEKQK